MTQSPSVAKRYTQLLCALSISLATSLVSTYATAQQPTRSILDEIRRQGVVVLGYSPEALPFSVGNKKNKPEGYSIDWCSRIVEHLKNQIQRPDLKIHYSEVPPDQMQRLVSSGGVHLMCAAVSDTPERRKTLRFSEPIFYTSVRLMVQKNEGVTTAMQLTGKSVAVLGRTSAEDAVAAFSNQNQLKLVVSRVVSPEAMMSQLTLKQVHALARDDVLLMGMRAKQPRPADFVLLPEKLSNDPVSIALPNDAELQKIVDQAMAIDIRSGAADQLYTKWFIEPNPLIPKIGLNMPRPALLDQAWQVFR